MGLNQDKMRDAEKFMLETKRQAVHLTLGLSISFAVYLLTPYLGYLILAPLIAALLLLYMLPKRYPNLRLANHLIVHFERDNDIVSCPFRGSIWYGVGIMPPIIASLSFGMPLEVACAIIAVLSVGDSTSTWFGKFFGRVRFGEKSLLGFLAFFIFSTLAVLLYLQDLRLALILGLAGAIIEFFAVVDDNLLIPLGLTLLYYGLNII